MGLLRKKKGFSHIQETQELTWSVKHRLESRDVIVAVYTWKNVRGKPGEDTMEFQVLPATTCIVNENVVELTFNNPIAGRVVVAAIK